MIAPQLAQAAPQPPQMMGTQTTNAAQGLVPPPPITGGDIKADIYQAKGAMTPALPTPPQPKISPPPPPFPPDKVVEWVRSLPTPLEMIESLPLLRDFGDPLSDLVRLRKNLVRSSDDSHAMSEDTRRMTETMHSMGEAIHKVANWKLPFT